MNMTLVFFLGMALGGLGGIFLIGLVILIREGLQDARELKDQGSLEQTDVSPAPEPWETYGPVPWLPQPSQVSGQFSRSYDSQMLVPFRRVQASLEH